VEGRVRRRSVEPPRSRAPGSARPYLISGRADVRAEDGRFDSVFGPTASSRSRQSGRSQSRSTAPGRGGSGSAPDRSAYVRCALLRRRRTTPGHNRSDDPRGRARSRHRRPRYCLCGLGRRGTLDRLQQLAADGYFEHKTSGTNTPFGGILTPSNRNTLPRNNHTALSKSTVPDRHRLLNIEY
jgi:hypothetical protein